MWRVRTLLDHGMVDIHDILGLDVFGSLLESSKSVPDTRIGNQARTTFSVSVKWVRGWWICGGLDGPHGGTHLMHFSRIRSSS